MDSLHPSLNVQQWHCIDTLAPVICLQLNVDGSDFRVNYRATSAMPNAHGTSFEYLCARWCQEPIKTALLQALRATIAVSRSRDKCWNKRSRP